ncbi:hypothetical protein JX265_000908 [Neoarthrinium moseri]|uniref:Uncharacterized protein n=1 Tax=Neoarthrinium moseri TaxID=1658444 RepID=A0A9P9WWP1_9PEZI|nr:hypothetical protein JX265_000908 [Neoarthrinium moseri]
MFMFRARRRSFILAYSAREGFEREVSVTWGKLEGMLRGLGGTAGKLELLAMLRHNRLEAGNQTTDSRGGFPVTFQGLAEESDAIRLGAGVYVTIEQVLIHPRNKTDQDLTVGLKTSREFDLKN